MATRKGYALSALAAAVFAVAWVGAQAESHVRIIRLSYIDGSVQMDRATGQGLEKANLNTPITEGARLVTGNDGLAEVEFENNSTVRLGENSEIRFTKLVVSNEGAKVNDLEVVKGTVYFDTKGSKDDIYRAKVGNSEFQIHKDTELRLSDDTGKTTVAVMKGEADLLNQAQEVKIKKKETLTVDSSNAVGYEVAKGVEADRLDRWNNERSSYQTAYSYNNTGIGPKMNGFGYSDLSYYGGWFNVPGVGYAWQPYGISNWYGWNPYMAGAWSFSPAFGGYAWASAYPWGWLPYHYGSWSYMNGSGWFWVPGATSAYNNSGWYANNFQTVPVVHGPAGWQAPTAPPAVSSAAAAPTVKVGTIGNLPAYIPGGRPVPNFRSVVPNSMATRPVTSSAASTTHSGNTVYAPNTSRSNAIHGNNSDKSLAGANTAHNSGHVYAAPPRATVGLPGEGAVGRGGSYGGGYSAAGVPTAGSPMGSAGSVHASGGSHASSGAGHGSPK